jgi:hypothetical protein
LAGLKDCLKPCILKCFEELGGEATMSKLQYCLLRSGLETYTGAGVMAVARVLGGLARWGKVERISRFRYRLKN